MPGELGNHRARRAASPEDLRRAQALRWRRFRAGAAGAPPQGLDADGYDADAVHFLIEDAGGRLACTFRARRFARGADLAASYAARFYDLRRLTRYPRPLLEVGRFCLDEGAAPDPAVLRVAWAALRSHVEAEGAALLFGCTSFAGTDGEPYGNAFSLLAERHLAPARWSPGVKAPHVLRYAERPRAERPDLRAALRSMPPLLRSYLAMGAWVSDHAVVDADLGTLHVFTGLEVDVVPAARLRALRVDGG